MLDDGAASGALAEAREFAEAHGLGGNLEAKLNYLASYAGGKTTRCRLFKDFAPLSFEFTMERLRPDGTWEYWFHGGLIFHGDHDGHGSGASPTLSVTVSPATGWSIHT